MPSHIITNENNFSCEFTLAILRYTILRIMESTRCITATEQNTESNIGDACSSWKILLNVPNAIGHIRLLLLLGFVLLDTLDTNNDHAKACCFMLSSSIFLDVVDGMAARALDQVTKFGYHYDIMLDCMIPIIVYGQCKNNLLLKSFAGIFSFACTAWCLLAMSTSWKVGCQPKYWPASAVANAKNGGQFTSFGSMLWYFGFAITFPVIYALDRNLIDFGVITTIVFVFAMLDLLSLMEYNWMYMQSLLELNKRQQQQEQLQKKGLGEQHGHKS